MTLVYSQTSVALIPPVEFQAINANGQPLAGGMVYTYQAGTSTPLATYTDSTGSVQNSNPVVLDSAGRASIWISANAYKIVVTDSLGAVQYTQDNVSNLGGSVPSPLPISEGGTGLTSTGSQLQVLRVKPNGAAQTLQYATLPIVSAPDYNFPAQTPGGTLTASSPATVALSPCPLGVAGTDTKHYLYVSGGTGTAEAVLITGGTCTSGSASGNITFTPANSHSGAWTIASATAGITEAEYSISAGGTITIPQSVTVQAAIPYLDNMTFQGLNGAWISAASSSATIFDADVPTHLPCPGSGCATGGPSDNITFRDLVLDAHAFAGSNNVRGIQELLPGGASDTQENGIRDVNIFHVACNNVTACLNFQRSRDVHVVDFDIYANSTILFSDASFNPQYNTYDAIVDRLTQHLGCINNDCGELNLSNTAVISFENAISSKLVNSEINALPGGTTGTDGLRLDGNVQDFNATGNSFDQCRVCIVFGTVSYTGTPYYPTFVQIENNAIDQPWVTGIDTVAGTDLNDFDNTTNIVIEGNSITNPRPEGGPSNSLINLAPYTRWVTINDNQFNGLQSVQSQYAINIGAHVDDVNIQDNHFSDFTSYTGTNIRWLVIDSTATNIYYTGPNNGNLFESGTTLINDPADTVTAAATLTIPVGRKYVYVNGATSITSASLCTTFNQGYSFTIIASAGVNVTKGNNLHLNSNFGPTTTDGSLSLVCNGSNWVETGRAVN